MLVDDRTTIDDAVYNEPKMTHKTLPHEARLALERARFAGAKVEALDAQLQLAKIANQTAQTIWQQAGVAAGVQENDVVTDDYRIIRKGSFVEEIDG